MKIGFIGLGKMGSIMTSRLLESGHQIVALDPDQAALQRVVAKGAIGATDRQQLVSQLESTAIIWLMVPAAAVETEIEALTTLLPSGSIIIDGGNSDFRLTRERAKKCVQAGIQLVDVGTSGGVLAENTGYCLMVGGNQQAFKTIEPIIKNLAAEAGYGYFGPSGAGHYIKMIHNAIEYGLMESYAEGYRLLKEGSDYSSLDLPAIAEVWQHGSLVEGKLNAITGSIFKANPELQAIDGAVAETGEARWTLEIAQAQQLDLPAVQTAMDVRLESQHGQVNFGTKLLAAMRQAFGGHKVTKD